MCFNSDDEDVVIFGPESLKSPKIERKSPLLSRKSPEIKAKSPELTIKSPVLKRNSPDLKRVSPALSTKLTRDDDLTPPRSPKFFDTPTNNRPRAQNETFDYEDDFLSDISDDEFAIALKNK